MRAVCLLLVLAGVLVPRQAAAQLPAPGEPGPFVIDIRGATGNLPTAPGFFPSSPILPPALDSGEDEEPPTVPGRGYGFDLGAHVYAGRLGAAKLGFGASVLRVTGTAEEVRTTVTALVPQMSFNFGDADGWSYLSAGYGRAEVRESGWVPAINVGGGARWFLTRHAAFGFDLRYHRFSGGEVTPAASLFAISAGVSLR